MKKIISFSAVLGLTPVLTFAAGSTVGSVLATIVGYLNYIVPALITIAVIYFIVGVVSFMTSSDEEAKKKGRTKIINGLIGLFVIVAFWGIIGLVKRSFDIDNQTGDSIIPCTGADGFGDC
jgi:4-hydroxybenzoate polyprenyltransferase